METGETKTLYELAYHLVPTLTEDAVGAEVARVREIIERAGGTVASEEWPKQMELAYTIARREQGGRGKYDTSYFGWVRFEASRSVLPALTQDVDALDTVLRHLIVEAPREVSVPRKRRTKPVLKRVAAADEKVPTPSDSAASEEIDREIEKLVAE